MLNVIKVGYSICDDNFARKDVTLIGFVYEIEDGGWVKGIAISTGDEDYIVEMNFRGYQIE